MDIRTQQLSITTAAGVMPVHVARPADGGPYPLVLIYMDVNGIRDELKRFAARFASDGYITLLPDFYYRFGADIHFDHTIPVHERAQADIDRLVSIMNALKDEFVMADTAVLLDQFADDPGAVQGGAGCVGYCMGGRHVMRALSRLPQRFAAGAAHFPTWSVTDAADSPHREVSSATGAFYFCFGARDNLISAEHVASLKAALDAAHSVYELKVHATAGHGYAFCERRSGYEREAAEYDWERTLALFEAHLWNHSHPV